ncbi:MAG: hypothetical protein ABI321_04520 [Polyangia bacterium]
MICRAVVVLAFVLGLGGTARAGVHYRIDASRRSTPPGPTMVTVDIDAAPAELAVVFANWIPGAYELRWFGRDVQGLTSSTGTIERVSAARFVVSGHKPGAPLRITYRITSALLSDDGAEVSAEHVYVNPAAMLPMVIGAEQEEVTLAIDGLPQSWPRVCSRGLAGDTLYRAASFFQLADTLFEASPGLATHVLTVDGARITIALDATRAIIPPALVDVVEKLLHAEVAIAGPLPFSRYLLLVHRTDRPGHSVGLEHADATSILIPEAAAPAQWVDADLRHMLAHELFHAWNARRLVPEGLATWTPEIPQSSRSLWISEGLTEYAALVAQAGAGTLTTRELAASLDELLTRARRAEVGLSLETLSQLAFSAPHVLAADEDAYYAVGAVASLVLVCELVRHSTYALPALMATLLPKPGAPARTIDRARLGAALDALLPGTSKLLEQLAAQPLSFATMVEHLQACGLVLALGEPSLDTSLVVEDHVVRYVEPGGAWVRAGVLAGDTLVSLDGLPFTKARLDSLAARTQQLVVTRAGERLKLPITPRLVPGKVTVSPASLETSCATEACHERARLFGALAN